jgi:hypothetical protein
MSIVETLTEGIVNRDLAKEGSALITKWEQTGLLEGITDDTQKNGMARLLENQAKELLREASTMASGDVEGFAAVAFPLVRRVFGSLIANELVSVQPMSLPSGLIFFLDFTFGGTFPSNSGNRLDNKTGNSIYGGGVVGSQITGGLDLSKANAEKGPYSLNNGYSSPTGSVDASTTLLASGTIKAGGIPDFLAVASGYSGVAGYNTERLLRFDPDLVSGAVFAVAAVPRATIESSGGNLEDLVAFAMTQSLNDNTIMVRRLTREDFLDSSRILVTLMSTTASTTAAQIIEVGSDLDAITHLQAPIRDEFDAGGAVGSVIGSSSDFGFGLEDSEGIPEIDIKVDSVAVTAVTKKLKAKWTPELGQDLNAYHNLDAEVELTQILSEQIALEIDREILEDLIKLAEAGIRYWSRHPGQFLNRETGEVSEVTQDFTGNVSEWYETLVETINDVSAEIHRRTLRGAANFVVCGPEVANILEFTAGFRANVTADADKGDIGAIRVGSLSKKFDVMVDPYFPRNVVLVGRRGSSFLESGYVYAPYVPLQTTPTIFGVEDFVPRKGVMTRYAKKMVRPDMYGLVICRGLED